MLWLAMALASTGAGALVRAGGEFQVNSYTIDQQKASVIATDDDGDFVVVWTSLEQDEQSWGVFAQPFSSSGAPVAQEFQVNSYTFVFQQYPATAMDADGDFVIAWTSYRQDGLSRGVFGRRYTSAGAPLGVEFQVAVLTVTNQSTPAVAMHPGGEFVVAWQGSKVLTGGAYNIYARLFGNDGAPTSGEIQVSTYTQTNQLAPSIAGEVDGDFVVSWTGRDGMDGFGDAVLLRRFTSAGAALGAELRVNAYTSSSQTRPSVAMDADGDFIVSWTSYTQDGSSGGVFARRFSSAGVPGNELRLNIRTSGNQHDPKATMDRFGRLVVAWSAENVDASYQAVVARRFSRSGAAVGGEFLVNTRTIDNQLEPVAAIDDSADFVITWTSSQQDGFDPGDSGVFGQRFDLTLDVDGDWIAEPLTDGLLILRHFFGFAGATLASGAVNLAECTQCTGADVKTRLLAIESRLDIDGNGQRDALTDGLLVQRYLFGFNGAALVSGAVGANCTRCGAGAISTYLRTLGP
jgi:hypothetical protein